MGSLRFSHRRGPATAVKSLSKPSLFVSEHSRDPRGYAPGSSLLQNGGIRSICNEKAARTPRQRSDLQLDRKHTRCRLASAATWDQPSEPETTEVAPQREGAPAGTISTQGAIINTLNIMVCFTLYIQLRTQFTSYVMLPTPHRAQSYQRLLPEHTDSLP